MDVDRAKDSLEKADITLSMRKPISTSTTTACTFDIQAKKLAHDRQVLLVQDLQRQVDDLNVRRRWTVRSVSSLSPNALPLPKTRSCSA
jgi:HlyD family secretion protein